MRPAIAEDAADKPGIDLPEARRVEADKQQDLQRVQARCDSDAFEDQIVGARHAAAPVREEKTKAAASAPPTTAASGCCQMPRPVAEELP